MSRIRLVHWKPEEAQPRVDQLAGAGYDVAYEPMDPNTLRGLTRNPPDAFVIDLTRLPSHGRDVGLYVRERKTTRRVPIVFVGGAPDKVARAKERLPDAVYADWPGIHEALAQAMAHPPSHPVVPDSNLAGYSGTPLPRKLGIKPGYAVALVGAPDDFERTLGELPSDVTLRRRAQGRCDLIVWFVGARRDLERRVARYGAKAGAGGLWICWPKKASGVVSDLSERLVRETGLAHGLVDYKIAAIDSTWSGLRFTRRKSG